MTTTITEKNHSLVITFDGRLDTLSAPQAEKALAPLANRRDTDIIIDCSRLEYISSGGLRVLLTAQRLARQGGNSLCISRVNETVNNILTITGFVHLFDFK